MFETGIENTWSSQVKCSLSSILYRSLLMLSRKSRKITKSGLMSLLPALWAGLSYRHVSHGIVQAGILGSSATKYSTGVPYKYQPLVVDTPSSGLAMMLGYMRKRV